MAGPDRGPVLGALGLALAVTGNIAAIGLLLGLALVPAWAAEAAAWFQGIAELLPFAVSGDSLLGLATRKAALLCVAVLPVMLLELALAGWQRCSLGRLLRRRTVSARHDLLFFALQFVGVWKYLVQFCTLGGAAIAGILLAQLAASLATHGLQIHTGSLLADTGLAFLLFTFTDYWSHRVFHSRYFWPLHRMHHSATEMTALTLWRNHPVAPAIDAFFKVWPLALFDVPAGVVGGVGLGVLAYQHLIHANIGGHWGWFGDWVLIPPAGHRLHHARDPALHDRNLGIPVIWDRLFGTWADPRLVTPETPIGVGDAPTNTGRIDLEAWRDLRDWLRGLWPEAVPRRWPGASAPGTAGDTAPPRRRA